MYKVCAETLGCHLMRRVETLHIVKYGESLLLASIIAGSHCWQQVVIFTNFEGLPLPWKGQWGKKSTMCMHVEHCSWTKILKVKNMSCLSLNFYLPMSMIARSRFFNTNNSTKFRRNSKSLWGLFIGTRVSLWWKIKNSLVGLSLSAYIFGSQWIWIRIGLK
jgi:hypothetical protein